MARRLAALTGDGRGNAGSCSAGDGDPLAMQPLPPADAGAPATDASSHPSTALEPSRAGHDWARCAGSGLPLSCWDPGRSPSPVLSFLPAGSPLHALCSAASRSLRLLPVCCELGACASAQPRSVRFGHPTAATASLEDLPLGCL